MPEDTGFFGMRNTNKTVVGGGLVMGALLPQLWHSSHGWTQKSGELSREAAYQAINAESTKCWAVNVNWRLFLLPEVFVFMVHYVFRVHTCACAFIKSPHFKGIMGKPILYSIIWALCMEPGGKQGIFFYYNWPFPCCLSSYQLHQLLWIDRA